MKQNKEYKTIRIFKEDHEYLGKYFSRDKNFAEIIQELVKRLK